MDMAILGANPERYREYCQQIRQEFKQVDAQLFRLGRLAFVKKLLSKEKIFLTEKLLKIFENQAISNLREEVKSLR